MSDNGRQSLTDKVSAAVKPDSEKSNMEHIGDKLKGAVDSAAEKLQPNSNKSTPQQVSDSLSGNSSDKNSLLDKAKDANPLGDNKSN
ncbi:heat shock protein 9/12-domain-containing protein [Lactifluus volemus]|nr:heat shock protein 9/12-domain-containing protein [Lactifluus volemus]